MAEYDATVRVVHGAPAAGLTGQLVVLASVAATVGLGGAGWAVGALCAFVLFGLLARSLARDGAQRLGPAGWITLGRAMLAVGVAALTADSFTAGAPAGVLAGLAAVALALDFVDGRVARRTGTESPLGAALDGEIDAFLMLVLSVYVAPAAGWWVLPIGGARYAFLVAGLPLAWMRAPLPRRDWRKVVTAVAGVSLVVAAAGVLPPVLTRAGLGIASLLLAESFGRDVWWLWRHRHAPVPEPAPAAGPFCDPLSPSAGRSSAPAGG